MAPAHTSSCARPIATPAMVRWLGTTPDFTRKQHLVIANREVQNAKTPEIPGFFSVLLFKSQLLCQLG